MFKRLCRWEEPEAPPCLSPTRPPGSPPRPALPKEQVGDDQRVVLEAKVKLLIFSRLSPYYLLSSDHCWRGCATSPTLWLSRCSALFSILNVIWSGFWNCNEEQRCQPVQIICICPDICAFSVLLNRHCADICTICQKCQFEVRKG